MVSWSLLAFGALTFVAATSGGIFRPGNWYRALKKPTWNPPDWLFPIAWTALYGLIAFAAWLVWTEAGWPAAAVPLAVWVLQLALNGLWSALFFGKRRMDLAFYDLIALWLSIVLMTLLFYRVEPLAGLLMLPYIAWVSFAGLLNWTVWRMNPDAIGGYSDEMDEVGGARP